MVEKVGTSLLFENEQIRIWSLLLEPGDTAPVHQHEFPYVYLVVAPGSTLMTESDGNEVRSVDDKWEVVRHDAGLPHTLQNLGSTRYENAIIEFKQDGPKRVDSAPKNPDEIVAKWLESFAPADAVDEFRRHLDDNPGRISRGYGELLEGYTTDAAGLLKITKIVEDGDPRPGWVTVDEIDFVSLCPHHFLPYFGIATVSYHPKSKILGLGKLPRYVEALARRFVIQEDLTQEIAAGVGKAAGTDDVKVSTTASHICICRRGARQARARTSVEYVLGG